MLATLRKFAVEHPRIVLMMDTSHKELYVVPRMVIATLPKLVADKTEIVLPMDSKLKESRAVELVIFATPKRSAPEPPELVHLTPSFPPTTLVVLPLELVMNPKCVPELERAVLLRMPRSPTLSCVVL